jgi:hypothetical protein
MGTKSRNKLCGLKKDLCINHISLKSLLIHITYVLDNVIRLNAGMNNSVTMIDISNTIGKEKRI